MTLRTGYRYTNVWYKNPAAIDRQEHTGYVEGTYALSPNLNLTANYTYIHESSVNPFDRHAPNIGFRYEYKERSFVFGQIGYTWFSSKNIGASNYPFWNAGVTHAFNTLSVSLSTGVQYPIDPLSGLTRETDYSFAVTKELGRGSIGMNLSYANYSGSHIDTENRIGAGITARYELSPGLQGAIAGIVEKYDHRVGGSYTRRISINPTLIYTISRDITLALNYSYINYYSPTVFTDNYSVNRAILEVRKTF
jgi:uncharacterized protein (PEP-CTERM system associated)